MDDKMRFRWRKRVAAILGLTVAFSVVPGAAAALANGDHNISWSGVADGNSYIEWRGTKNYFHSTNVHSYGRRVYAGAYPFRDLAPDPNQVYHLTGDTTLDAHGSGDVNGRIGELGWDGLRLAIYENVSLQPDPHGPEATDRR
jgi:hypothetical protein